MVGVWKSEGFGLDAATYEEYVRDFLTTFEPVASDGYGTGEPQLYAYALFGPGFHEPVAGALDTVYAIATSIRPAHPPDIPTPKRSALIFRATYDGERWAITRLTVGPIEFLDPVGLAQPGDRYAVVAYTEFYQLWQPQP